MNYKKGHFTNVVSASHSLPKSIRKLLFSFTMQSIFLDLCKETVVYIIIFRNFVTIFIARHALDESTRHFEQMVKGFVMSHVNLQKRDFNNRM